MSKLKEYFTDLGTDVTSVRLMKFGEVIGLSEAGIGIYRSIFGDDNIGNSATKIMLGIGLFLGIRGARKLIRQNELVSMLKTSTNNSYYFPGLDTNVALGDRDPLVHYIGYVSDLEEVLKTISGGSELRDFTDHAGAIFVVNDELDPRKNIYIVYRPSPNETTDVFTRGYYEGHALGLINQGYLLETLVKGHIKPHFKLNNDNPEYLAHLGGVYACIIRGKDPRQVQGSKINRDILNVLANQLSGQNVERRARN